MESGGKGVFKGGKERKWCDFVCWRDTEIVLVRVNDEDSESACRFCETKR